MLVDGAFAEAIDGDDYIIGGLCPAERLWSRIGGIDVGFSASSSRLSSRPRAAVKI
jgi:hypothetical protein